MDANSSLSCFIFAPMTNNQDTICALSTPNGVGAIALIRVSGKKALEIVSGVFSKNLLDKNSHTAHFGYFKNPKGELIDEVLITVFANGKSFTGEESAEIACHASPYIQQQIIQTLLDSGCRLANPGEYTMRAFLNGKLDLSQAEAVADLIASQSKGAHDIALKQLRGGFSSELKDGIWTDARPINILNTNSHEAISQVLENNDSYYC